MLACACPYTVPLGIEEEKSEWCFKGKIHRQGDIIEILISKAWK